MDIEKQGLMKFMLVQAIMRGESELAEKIRLELKQPTEKLASKGEL